MLSESLSFGITNRNRLFSTGIYPPDASRRHIRVENVKNVRKPGAETRFSVGFPGVSRPPAPFRPDPAGFPRPDRRRPERAGSQSDNSGGQTPPGALIPPGTPPPGAIKNGRAVKTRRLILIFVPPPPLSAFSGARHMFGIRRLMLDDTLDLMI